MADSRLEIAKQKTMCKVREALYVLQDEKYINNPEKSRVLIESLILDQKFVDVYVQLKDICEELQSRTLDIKNSKECPIDLKSSISTLIFCSKILGFHELDCIRKQFKWKYGKKFVQCAAANSDGTVQEGIYSKLSVPAPPLLVQDYIEIFRKQDLKKVVLETKNCSTKQEKIVKTETAKKSSSMNALPIDTSEYVFVKGRNDSQEELKPDSDQDTVLEDDTSSIMTSRVGMSLSPAVSIEPIERPLGKMSPALPYRVFCPNPRLEIAFDVRTKNPVYVMERLATFDDKNTTISPGQVQYTIQSHRQHRQRRPHFFEELELPDEYRSRLEDYFHSGYDRGHMAPAADFSKEGGNRLKDTFTMCNISPQVHSMNVSIWAKLENWCRRVGKVESDKTMDGHESGGETYVVTGPLWLPTNTVSTKHHEYHFDAIGESSSSRTPVHVPTHFFKVIVVILGKEIRKFACFVVPNSKTKNTKESLEKYLVKWSDLEAMSGLQFFPSHTLQGGWKQTANYLADIEIAKSPIETNIPPTSVDWKKRRDKIGPATQLSLEHLAIS